MEKVSGAHEGEGETQRVTQSGKHKQNTQLCIVRVDNDQRKKHGTETLFKCILGDAYVHK